MVERLGGLAGTARFNRAENVRQIPPGDPDRESMYERRNDAERPTLNIEPIPDGGGIVALINPAGVFLTLAPTP